MYVISFDKETAKRDELHKLGEAVQELSGDQNVLIIPNGFSCMKMKKDELKNLIDALNNYYNNLEE